MRRLLKYVAIGLPIVLLLAALAYLAGPLLFVIRGKANLPPPGGDFDVGRLRMAMIDETRDEAFTPDIPDDRREFVVNVFYPASLPAGASPGLYMEPAVVKDVTGVPAFLLSPIKSHWVADAPIVDDEFPVLLFASGWIGPGEYYTTLIEEIVSHGYVVAMIDSPYSFEGVIFPDGRIITGNDMGQAEGDFNSEADKEAVSAVWVDDFRFLLDQLTLMNEDHETLAGHLDLERVGMFGHSFGGQVAAAVTLLDERIKAGIDYDGSIVDERVVEQGVGKPFLLFLDEFEFPYDYMQDEGISEEEWRATWAERNYPPSLHKDEVLVLYLVGARHSTFQTDLPILQPMFPMLISEDLVGSFSDDSARDIISAYTLAFFETHLNGEPSPLLDGPSADYPQIGFGVDDSGWEW